MLDASLFRPADSWIWIVAWQATAFLAAGIAASFALRGRPARAHRALLLAIVATLASPALTEAGRRMGLGLWDEPRAVSAAPVITGEFLSIARVDETPLVPAPARIVGEAAGPIPRAEAFRLPSRSWRGVFLKLWGLSSLVLAVRLAASFESGQRLVGRATEIEDHRLRGEIEAAARGLGLSVAPMAALSDEVRCPAVWCWGRRPLLLLPEGLKEAGRLAVLRHELAHWLRRDHLATLGGEILACVLPWHPLAWVARARLGYLAELACDDWVLASGERAADYAEALLALAPQRPAAALAASGRNGLRTRIARVLADVRREPAAGRGWSAAACLGTFLIAWLAALAQARPAVAEQPKEGPAMKTVSGRVLDRDGKPVAGAQVHAIGERQPRLPHVAQPQGERDPAEVVVTTGPAVTGPDGRFTVAAPDSYSVQNPRFGLLTNAKGFGPVMEKVSFEKLDREHEIRLAPGVCIAGRLLAPDGSPAARAEVKVYGFTDKHNRSGSYAGGVFPADATPDYWPRPAATDDDGRFSIDNVPADSYVCLRLSHPQYALEELYVNTIPAGTISPEMKAFDIVPVLPTFTHTFRPARPVGGRVTDQETGRPLVGVSVQVTPMREHGGQGFFGRTDADGRYHVSAHFADHFYVKAIPDADSGYLIAEATRMGWPDGAKSLNVDFALEKGRRIAGRVVDQETRRPVAGAAVAYEALHANPHRRQSMGGSGSPVLTDVDGRFVVTGLAGAGYLAVETEDPGRVRVSARPNRGIMPGVDGPTVRPQGYAEVDIPEAGEPAAVEIEVRQGVTLEARVVDPDGRPIDVAATYPGNNSVLNHSQTMSRMWAEGGFRIEGADPDRTYRVIFVNAERNLGAVAELKHRPGAAPTEVKVQPTAAVHGRFLTAEGQPAKDRAIFARASFVAGPPDTSDTAFFDEERGDFYANLLGEYAVGHYETQLGKDGAFRFDALVPGVGCYVVCGEPRRNLRIPAWDLSPGEERDLGTIRLPEAAKN